MAQVDKLDFGSEFQDDMVKDHRTGKSATISKVLSGHFDVLW